MRSLHHPQVLIKSVFDGYRLRGPVPYGLWLAWTIKLQKALASQEAAQTTDDTQTTERLGCQATITGLPSNCGSSGCLTN
jgi:hypothetical protein